MEISTNQYQVASLEGTDQAVTIIQEAEQALKQVTGDAITLIAYEKAEQKTQ